MTNEEILKIAESVSINFAHRNYEEDLVEFARLVANIEREACAKICDSPTTEDTRTQRNFDGATNLPIQRRLELWVADHVKTGTT